ncbi:integrase, catalytic region, zinc finger, CCHC-type containing protein [Tanacetum coccineum]
MVAPASVSIRRRQRAGNANAGQGKPIKCYNCNGISHISRNCTQSKRSQNFDYFKEKMLLMQAQENGVDLDEEQLLFLAGGQTNTFDDEVDEGPVQDMAHNEDNIFQVDQCDAFDSDVDEAPIAQQYHNNCLDNMNESHEEHEIHNDVQPNDVVDSDTKYTSNINIISYEQYVQDNENQVVHNDVSSVPNDAVMIITNDIYEYEAPCVTSNNTVNAPLTAELARYKELAEVYEKRAQFKLTKRELMIDTQMRMTIKDRNVKEESLQQELHSVKMQLNSTLNHNKLIWEEAKALKEKAKSAKPITDMTVIIKEQFEGIQTALIKEIKEMKEVFDQMEAEVDQHVVDKKYDEIERKNLLIENENLIVDCLSKDVFYTATNYVLIVSIFSDMHDAYTAAQKLTSSVAPAFESVFEIGHLKEQLQGRGNTIRELKAKISRLQKKHSEADPILDFKALDS